MKRFFVCVFVVLIVCFLVGCSIIEDEILITSKSSPDSNYTVYLYQVGSPQWSFGSVNAKLVLKDNSGKIIDEENFGLANDGAGVFEGNIKEITWLDNHVEIIMGESDTTKLFTYILNYTE